MDLSERERAHFLGVAQRAKEVAAVLHQPRDKDGTLWSGKLLSAIVSLERLLNPNAYPFDDPKRPQHAGGDPDFSHGWQIIREVVDEILVRYSWQAAAENKPFARATAPIIVRDSEGNEMAAPCDVVIVDEMCPVPTPAWADKLQSAESMIKDRAAKKAPDRAADIKARLIESLRREQECIPYDPELMELIAEAYRRSWDKFDHLRLAVYRDVLPWFGPALGSAVKDPEETKQVHLRADREWEEKMNLPPLTSIQNLEIVQASAVAAGYPNTDPGLRAWVRQRNASQNGPPGQEQLDPKKLLQRSAQLLALHGGKITVVAIVGTDESDAVSCSGDLLHRFGGCIHALGGFRAIQPDGQRLLVTLAIMHRGRADAEPAFSDAKELARQSGSVAISDGFLQQPVSSDPGKTWFAAVFARLLETPTIHRINDSAELAYQFDPFLGCVELWKLLLARQNEPSQPRDDKDALGAGETFAARLRTAAALARTTGAKAKQARELLAGVTRAKCMLEETEREKPMTIPPADFVASEGDGNAPDHTPTSEGNSPAPLPAPRTLGDLLSAVASSESAYRQNIKVAEQYEAKGSPEALWWRIQAGALCYRPDASKSPGIDRLEAICHAEFGSGLTSENLRRIRGTLFVRLKCRPEDLDSMSIEEASDTYLSANSASGRPVKASRATDVPESGDGTSDRIRVLTHHSRPGHLDWREVRLSDCEHYGTVGPATEDLYFGTVEMVEVYRTADGCWFFVDLSRGEGHYQNLDQAADLFRCAGRPLPHELGGSPTTTTTPEPPTAHMSDPMQPNCIPPRIFRWADKEVELPKNRYRLVELLCENSNLAVKKIDIAISIWGDEEKASTALSSLARETNRQFEAAKIAAEVNLVGDYVRLTLL